MGNRKNADLTDASRPSHRPRLPGMRAIDARPANPPVSNTHVGKVHQRPNEHTGAFLWGDKRVLFCDDRYLFEVSAALRSAMTLRISVKQKEMCYFSVGTLEYAGERAHWWKIPSFTFRCAEYCITADKKICLRFFVYCIDSVSGHNNCFIMKMRVQVD